MQRRAFLAGTLSTLGALAWTRGSAAGEDHRLEGSYRFSGGAKERKAIEDAIEDVVEDMGIIARPIARKRLKAAARVHERIRIAVSDDSVTIELGDEKFTAPADGTKVEVIGSEGKEVQLSYRLDGGEITQRFEGEGGGKVNVFRPHGKRKMRVACRIYSDRLPKDLVYKLTYSAK
jgi:hypothetical protein